MQLDYCFFYTEIQNQFPDKMKDEKIFSTKLI